MLIVTIDIIPGGYAPARRTIASMRLSNISNLAAVSDYRVELLESANTLTGAPARIGSCEVKGHNRLQAVWALLAKASDAAMSVEFDKL
jgi:hypothetical protein